MVDFYFLITIRIFFILRVLEALTPSKHHVSDVEGGRYDGVENPFVTSRGFNCTMVQMRKKQNKNSRLDIYFPTSSGVSERASKQMSAAERASKASRAGQASEYCVSSASEQANE